MPNLVLPPRLPTAPSKRRSSDILAVIGLIILGVIVIWGFIHAAQLSSPWFSSLFSRSAPTIQVTAPESSISGIPFTISWKYDSAPQGYYAFLYSCQNDLQFKTAAAGGTGMINIPCGAAFSVASGNNTLSLTPTLTGNSSVKTTLSMVFIPANATGTRTEGSATITIAPGATTSTKALPAPTPAKTTKQPVQSGPADLSVKIVAIGVIDPSTDQFVNRPPMSPGDMVAVEFDISNVGKSASGSYYFDAHLPTQSGYTYISPVQSSLAPGDHILNTLRFTDIAQSGGIVSIQVDPSNLIHEAAKGNNYASQAVGMTGY